MVLKFAVRNLLKRPFLNLIKVIGLSIALSGLLLIALFLKNELTYDSFHEKSDRIYRFTTTYPLFISGKHFARLHGAGFIPQMSEYYTEIENYVRLVPIVGGVMKHEEKFIKINQAFKCDSTFFDLFEAQLLVGDPESILNNSGSMVVSESFAKKAFGKLNPVGQILTLPSGQYYADDNDFTINGIMKDFPYNSHFHPDFITTPVDKNDFNGWAWTYLLLSENASPDSILSGFSDFNSTHVEKKTDGIKKTGYLQNISDIHLHSDKLREIEGNSNMHIIYTLSIAALILLLIALTNYSNLNIGMSDFSEKYLHVSNVLGSSKWMSLRYFLTEGIIITLASITIAGFLIMESHIIIFKHFALNLFTDNIPYIISIVMLFSLLGILFGILPILKQLVKIIKSPLENKSIINLKRNGINKSLIVLQYAIAIALIIAVFVIQRQTKYALNSSMGVEANNLICIDNVHTSVQKKFEVFKEELLNYKSIESVSAMLEPPGGEANDMFKFIMEDYIVDEKDKTDNMIGIFPCDYSFASIFNLNFLSGNNFSEKNIDNEGSGEYIINKTAMRRLNYTNPNEIIGKEFKLIFNQGGITIPSGNIIGVVEDFHISSLKKQIEPLVMFKREQLWLINFMVSFHSDMQKSALTDIEGVWTKMFPEYPFQYEHVSSMYQNVYKTERLQASLLSIFTLISLFICSLGLLGLSLLTTQRRTKEIGIRKVNGAKIGEMMKLLYWDLIKWILISIVIAVPIAYFAMSKWLENFAYKTALSWWIFALAGLIALLIAFITVSIQSWKAASRNPIEALRYE